jgi:hypothetical protein
VAKPKHKQETVSASFHYLCRNVKQSETVTNTVPFHNNEFDALYTSLKNKPAVNMDDQAAADRVRFKFEVPIENIARVDARTISGTFWAAYWGHAYKNTLRGDIPAESISLRPFQFLLYLSESGRIYIGSQYLGQFGGYVGLQRTICDLLKDRENVDSSSFMLGSSAYKNADAKEVHVSFSDRSSSISSANSFAKTGMIVLKKSSKGDGFESQVKKRLLPSLGKSPGDVKKAVAELFTDSGLLDVKDTDIEDCTVVANVNGKRKTIYMLDNGQFATKFPMDVKVGTDGHPDPKQTVSAMLELLEGEIISRRENV